MIVEAKININGPKTAVWAVISNIRNATAIISGVEKVEILNEPASGLTGLKWLETRMYYGKLATIAKWITESVENEFYKTIAEMDGFIFITTLKLSGSDGRINLTSTHETKPQGIIAILKSLPMIFFKGMLKKAILQDLTDFKSAVEQN